MPGTLIERPKMTRSTYLALKQYIMRQREKRKEEEREQESVKERVRQEKELKRKKEEEHNLSLEQVSKQTSDLKTKLDGLQKRKRELFSDLRKVLQQDNTRPDKDTDPMRQLGNFPKAPAAGMPMATHPVFVSGGSGPPAVSSTTPSRPSMYAANRRPHQPSILSGMSARQSPSPPPHNSSTPYHPYKDAPGAQYKEPGQGPQGGPAAGGGKMPSAFSGGPPKPGPNQQHSMHSARSAPYPQPPRKSNYGYGPASAVPTPAAGAAHSGPGGPKPAGAHNSASQSAFTSYPSHYAQHRKVDPAYPSPQQPSHVGGAGSDYALSAYKTEAHARPDDKLKQSASTGNILGAAGRVGHPPQPLPKVSAGYPSPHGSQHPGSQHPGAYPSAQQQPGLRAPRPPASTAQQQVYSLPGGRLYRGPHPPSSGFY